jgi:hypothetical protein
VQVFQDYQGNELFSIEKLHGPGSWVCGSVPKRRSTSPWWTIEQGRGWRSPEYGLVNDAMAQSSLWLYQNREEVAIVLTEVFGGRCGDERGSVVKRNEQRQKSSVWGEWRHEEAEQKVE